MIELAEDAWYGITVIWADGELYSEGSGADLDVWLSDAEEAIGPIVEARVEELVEPSGIWSSPGA